MSTLAHCAPGSGHETLQQDFLGQRSPEARWHKGLCVWEGPRVDLPTFPVTEGRTGVIWQGPRRQAPDSLRLCLTGALFMRPHVSCHCSCLLHAGGTLYSHCTLWVFRAETPVEGLAGGWRAVSSPPGPQAGSVLSPGGPVQTLECAPWGFPGSASRNTAPSAETLVSCHHCHRSQAWDLGRVAGAKGVWTRSVKVSVGWLSGHQKVSGNGDEVMCHSQLAC